MPNNGATTWFHSNRYHAQAACLHCKGVIRHEPWCMEVDTSISYAYEIVANPHRLTAADALILHSLGVTWDDGCPMNVHTSL